MRKLTRIRLAIFLLYLQPMTARPGSGRESGTISFSDGR